MLRGGFGLFYDRPFDNLWQNVQSNNISLPLYSVSSHDELSAARIGGASFICQSASGARRLSASDSDGPEASQRLCGDSFSSAYSIRFPENLTLEVNGTGSLGRRLITSDIVNRQFTTTTGFDGRTQRKLPRYRVALEPGAFRLLRAEFPAALPPAHIPVSGRIHLEPCRRQSERPAGRGVVQPGIHDRLERRGVHYTLIIRAAIQQQRRSGEFRFRSAAEPVHSWRVAIRRAAASAARLASFVDGGIPHRVSLFRSGAAVRNRTGDRCN